MVDEHITITRQLLREQRKYPGAKGEMTALLNQIGFATKLIQREVSKAGLVEALGLTGKRNIQGENVQKLDEFANDVMIKVLANSGHMCVMASEEEDDIIHVPDSEPTGDYCVAFDPLDGSSNIDVNVTIGSIFSIYRRRSGLGKGSVEDLVRPGREQVAAGYVVYGSSTMFVYTTGQGVHGFTYDPSVGEYFLSHPNIRMPERGIIYSVNEGNYYRWDEKIRSFIDYVKTEDIKTNRPFSARYIGSLVADFHRTLLYGGIFLYPADTKNKEGKLRLLYEAFPLAMIAEQAGGGATDGVNRILDVIPESLHQRTPLVIGSIENVRQFDRFMEGERT